MHSTKTSHVSEKDVRVALSAAQSTPPEDSANNTRDEGKQTPPEGGCSQGTNSHQRPKQRFAPFFSAWKHWSFKGRASRSEYWFGMLTLLPLLCVIIDFFDRFKGIMEDGVLPTPYLTLAFFVLVVVFLLLDFGLLFFWTARRLHDCGNSSGLLLLSFLWLIGWMVLFLLCLRPSEPRKNKYGPVPYVE